jgi:hypothetical protein
MRDWDKDASNSLKKRATSAQRALVVRNEGDDCQLDDVVERVERLENTERSLAIRAKTSERREATTFDLRTMIAIAAILLSMTGYVIEDARNTSRQDAEIEATKVRVTNLEKIANANTEARIRTEVELGELKEGQNEIKQMLRAHDDQTQRILRKR